MYGTLPSGGLNAREVAKDSDFGPIEERYKTGGKLVLSFRLVPKSVTLQGLNDLKRRNGPYFALFQRFRVRCCRKTIIKRISVS